MSKSLPAYLMCVCVLVMDRRMHEAPTEGEVSVADRENDVCKGLNRGRCQSVSRNERRYSQSIESEPGKTDRHQIPAALMSQPEFRLYPKGPVCPSPCYWGQIKVA